ncbi:efflux RND transporter periplasmic adaptor subunit [Patescibacteria group bacterium]|nr:efflux RND transporter periplasmic adaptor subunit [Patescibacteria group bacterium]
MLKLVKKKWFWAIIVVLIIVAVVVFSRLSKTEVNYVTETAYIGDIRQTVEVTGSVEAADDIDLNFKTAGTLQEMLVKAGDEVRSGQTLARLFAGNVSSQVSDARASLEIAQLELDELLAGASHQDLKVTEEEVATAQVSYNTAIDNLANLESTRDNELKSLRQIAINALNDKYSIILYSLETVYDAILDDDADRDLYVSDIVALTEAKNNYYIAKASYDEDVDLIAQAEETSSDEDILASLDHLQSTLSLTLDALNKSFDSMVAALIYGHYSDTNIDAYKSNISTKSTAINTGIAVIQSAASDIRTRSLYYQNQIVDANNALSSAQASLNLAEAKLDFKKAPPRDFEIEATKARIKRAEATLNRYLSDWSETVIKAPVDGLVTKVNFDVGEQTAMSTPVISMIGMSNMQIQVDVPESDIVKLAVGHQVDVTLDAFSSEDKFSGTVTFIDPASTIIDGVVYYQVKIFFNEKDERIKSGMTADLAIGTDSREGVLIVPSRAVIYREGKKYVQIFDGKSLSEVEVETGLRGDGGLIEITSGLNDGDQVVTYIKNGQ